MKTHNEKYNDIKHPIDSYEDLIKNCEKTIENTKKVLKNLNKECWSDKVFIKVYKGIIRDRKKQIKMYEQKIEEIKNI